MNAAAEAARPWGADRLLRSLLRLVLAGLVLSLGAARFDSQVAQMLLPAFKAEMQWLDDTYRIDRLFIDQQGADKVIRVEVGMAHYIVLNGMAFSPDPRGKANASTLVANVTLPALLVLAAALAWPAATWRTVVMRLAWLVPALCLLWAVDVPMVLWASLWTLHVDAFAPGLVSPLLIWSDFLQGGGRLALACVLSVVVIRLSQPSIRRPAP